VGTPLNGAVEVDWAGVVYVADRSMMSGRKGTASEAHTKTLINLLISHLSSHVDCSLSSLLEEADEREEGVILEADLGFGPLCQTATAGRFDFDHEIVSAEDGLLVFRLEN
jgi:hypothetical protein